MQPRFSVITVATASDRATGETLDAIGRTLIGVTFESFVIRNGLPVAATDLQRHPVASTVLTTADIVSPGALLNSALDRAHGEYVAFFAGGAVPMPFWHVAAQRVLSRAGVVAAAARILDSAGRYVRSCGSGVRDGRLANNQAGLPADARTVLRPSPLDLAPLCGLVVRRDAFGLVGAFDSEFTTSLYDFDWTLRARVKGGAIAYCPDFVVRFEGTLSHGTAAAERQSAEHFLARWQTVFSPPLEAERFLP